MRIPTIVIINTKMGKKIITKLILQDITLYLGA